MDEFEPVRFEIAGKPFAKQRPLATRQGRVYTPKETVSYEAKVAEVGLRHFDTPLEGPVKVTIIAVFEPAKSWSKKKTAAHLWQPHIQRPDIDNCQKAILDGLNRVAFADDGQVCQIEAKKVWGTPAKTVVVVERVGVFQ